MHQSLPFKIYEVISPQYTKHMYFITHAYFILHSAYRNALGKSMSCLQSQDIYYICVGGVFHINSSKVVLESLKALHTQYSTFQQSPQT